MMVKTYALCSDSVAKQPKGTPHLLLELLRILHSPSEGKCQPTGSGDAVVPTRISLACAPLGSYLQQDEI
jgi:hypothetical protein